MTAQQNQPSTPNRLSQSPDDLAMMQAMASRDESALSSFYDRYSPLVCALCLRVLHDRAEAEAVMVDVFWELWERAPQYNPSRGAPRTYLMTIARSRAIDRRRRLGRKHEVVVEGQILEGQATAKPGQQPPGGPDAPMIAGEQRSQVCQALEQLEPGQRQALEMAFFDGLSHTQIAEALGSPLGTVKTRVRQGLIRLRVALSKAFSVQDLK